LGKYITFQQIIHEHPYEPNHVGSMLGVSSTKAELVQEIQRVYPEINTKSLMRASKSTITIFTLDLYTQEENK